MYSVLPISIVVFVKFTLVVKRYCTIKVRATKFVLLLVLLVLVLFLEFDESRGLTVVLAPLSFKFNIPTLVPVKTNLLNDTLSTLPTKYNIIVCCFVQFMRTRSTTLDSPTTRVTRGLGLVSSKLIRG